MTRYLLILPLLLLGCSTAAPPAQPRATAAKVNAPVPSWPRRRVAPTGPLQKAAAPATARQIRPGLIGIINMADGGAPMGRADSFKTAKNPRGYWGGLVGDLDLRDPASYPQFRANCTAFVKQSFDRAEKLGCDGVLWWDIEGGEYRDSTYVGDPLRLPPELDRDTVKAWCDEAQQRKLKVGFTFRDTNAADFYGGYQAHGDPTQILCAKLQNTRFAYGNGICLAYLDTFCEPSTWSDGKIHYRPAGILQNIQTTISGWYIFLEFGAPLYDDVPRVYSLRWQRMFDDATGGKAGDLLPKVSAHEILVPFAGNPTSQQLAQYRKAIASECAWSFICVTWDRPDTAWVPGLMKPGPATP